jgi:hypothetical protein
MLNTKPIHIVRNSFLYLLTSRRLCYAVFTCFDVGIGSGAKKCVLILGFHIVTYKGNVPIIVLDKRYIQQGWYILEIYLYY